MSKRPDFAHNLADGFATTGQVAAHYDRSKVRAAGSMDTTIEDFAKFLAGLMRGEGLSAAGLGVIVRDGPQGPAFFKGGHFDSTGNTWVCLTAQARCVALLANDVRAEALFPGLVGFILGETGTPWDWESGR